MEDRLRLLVRSLGEDRVKLNIDVTDYLHTQLGGEARAFYLATTTKELVKAIELCQELKIHYMVVGSGTKVALSGEGLSGLVIKNRSDQAKIFGIKGKISRNGLGIEEALIEADSGMSLSKLSEYSKLQKLGGFENLSNIPGTIGGSFLITPVLKENAQQVKIIDKSGEIKVKVVDQVLKDDVILSVVFKLKAAKMV